MLLRGGNVIHWNAIDIMIPVNECQGMPECSKCLPIVALASRHEQQSFIVQSGYLLHDVERVGCLLLVGHGCILYVAAWICEITKRGECESEQREWRSKETEISNYNPCFLLFENAYRTVYCTRTHHMSGG